MNEDIEKLFFMDIREKKRIGSNIFKRVSTRRGGSNMSTMRVPTKKQQKELSSKVTTFNLNTILSYEEFKNKPVEDQKKLMEYWREHFKSKEIMNEMGITKNIFYKLLDEVGIKKDFIYARNNTSQRIKLEEEELQRLIEDKNNYCEFELFKTLASEQQDLLFNEYFNRVNNVTLELERDWEGSNSGYLYYIKSRVDKKKKKMQVEKVEPKQISFEEKSAEIVEPPSEDKKEVIEPFVEEEVETIEEEPKTVLKDHHSVNINMQKENPNTFSFSLNGVYTKEVIIRRMRLMLEEIEESEESLTVEINIRA